MIGIPDNQSLFLPKAISTNPKNKIILTAIIIGFIFYILDAVLYYLVFAEGNTFLQILITAVPLSEIYNRLLLFVALLMLGFISSGFLSDVTLENDFLKNQPTAKSKAVDTDFISGLSSQIRTPLNAIVGFSELLKDPNLSAQSKQTYVNHIHASGNYLLQLINNLTDISKIESDQMVIDESNIRINDLFNELKTYFEGRKRELRRDQVDLTVINESNNSDTAIKTDGERLKQVLTNLLEIAFKNTEEGSIEMGYTLKNQGFIEIYVKDTGKGYSARRLEVLFTRYQKLSVNQDQPFDGVALRLSISKSLIKLLGGKLNVSSKLGQGATFFFSLPYQESQMATGEKTEDSDIVGYDVEEKKDWSKYCILITEDIESNFIYLQAILKPTGVKLVWAKNGKEAVKAVDENKNIDLVLMDILMPEMDGYEASKKIKQIRKDIPIIAQTAYILEDNNRTEELRNFDNYLIKPIWSHQLVSALEEYFS